MVAGNVNRCALLLALHARVYRYHRLTPRTVVCMSIHVCSSVVRARQRCELTRHRLAAATAWGGRAQSAARLKVASAGTERARDDDAPARSNPTAPVAALPSPRRNADNRPAPVLGCAGRSRGLSLGPRAPIVLVSARCARCPNRGRLAVLAAPMTAASWEVPRACAAAEVDGAGWRGDDGHRLRCVTSACARDARRLTGTPVPECAATAEPANQRPRAGGTGAGVSRSADVGAVAHRDGARPETPRASARSGAVGGAEGVTAAWLVIPASPACAGLVVSAARAAVMPGTLTLEPLRRTGCAGPTL